jgi:hypothetical protein
MRTTEALEYRVRSAAKKVGWRVIKSRARNLHINNRGLYQLVDDSNTVVTGADFNATLDEMADLIAKRAAQLGA